MNSVPFEERAGHRSAHKAWRRAPNNDETGSAAADAAAFFEKPEEAAAAADQGKGEDAKTD